MSKTILLTASYTGKPLDLVKSLVPEGFRLITLDETSQKDLEDKVSEADYILASGKLKINEGVVSRAPRLKMIQRLGVGLDSLDFSVLNKYGISVYVNSGVNSDSVAEHAIMFILSALRRLPIINLTTKRGVWKKQEQGVQTRELATQTVGIIGMGNIGRKVAKILKGFGCKTLYYDMRRLDCTTENELNVVYKDLEELYSLSDIITLHCPFVDATANMICEDSIRIMKDGVIIVNTSRGGLVNEKDLRNAIDSGKVGFAALDVFTEEPIKDFSLVACDNVICTPHIAGNTYDSFKRMMQCAFDSIYHFDQGNIEAIEEHRVYGGIK